ncbi:hypothetical protein TSUD_67530 [Trifolium subterraneum]|uniref:Reverse transcriptase zinc-binding domain-containing protein n=1 Tax=Trifolium subterraneum TaxID=3900 RepID=A0A2Z6NQD2_TRISU|nr:hypothetical protein TSUD_67530 [Trifolium subterraneum]
MMMKMGFAEKWVKWVKACIFNSSMSVLVNGNNLSALVNRTLSLSAKAIGTICGLSKQYLQAASTFLSCSIDSLPFRFLGLPVGSNPRRLSTWRPIIETTRKRLSGWGGRHLSIGDLLRFRYGSFSDTFLCRSVVTAKRTDSLWWRDILKVGGLEGVLWFSAEVSSVLGDGNSIGFWLEKWIGNNSLKEMYPNLFEKEQVKNVVVADKCKWVADRWIWRLFHEGFLLGTDAQDVASLHSLLAGHHPLNRKDKRHWIPDASGRFSVSSTYRFLQQRSTVEEICPNIIGALKKLWKNDLPLKVTIFGWRLLLDKIPTRAALHRRGVMTNPQDLVCCGGILYRDGKTGQARRVGPFNPSFMAGWVDIFNPPKWRAPSRLTRKKHGTTTGRGGLARRV